MRIAIDCRTILNPAFGEGAGVGHYTYYLVWHLLRLSASVEYVLFFDRRLGREAIDSLIQKRPRCQARFFPFYEYQRYLPGVYSHLLAGAVIGREKPDLLHVPGGAASLTYQGKIVLTVHDLAIYRHPEWFPSQLLSTKILYPQSLRRAAHLIAPSKQTTKDLQEIFKIPPEKISVVYEGVTPRSQLYDQDIFSEEDLIDLDDLKKKYKIIAPYLFFLGTIEPRKNLEFLLRVFDELLRQKPELNIQLVLAGGRGWKCEGVFKLIEQINRCYPKSRPAVNYLGYVPQRDKWALFQNALAFVYPSLYEGFGLPPLEAMAVGTPVIASRAGSLAEVIGAGGMVLAPDDFQGWLAALNQALKEPAWRSRFSEAGKRRAAEFSWSKCAEETLEVYQKLMI